MPKSPNQKLKLLYLQKILLEETDEEHPLTVNEIQEKLGANGISAERKSLYDDFETLRLFGTEVETVKSKTVGYYVAQRPFELAELKLLVDAVQSSKFITMKKTVTLIQKLEKLCSRWEARQLQSQVYVSNRVKSMNESIYYNVDLLNEAIVRDVKITYQYFEWDIGGQRRYRRNGEAYLVSPFALCWDDSKYYLVAYDEDSGLLKNYRVDKMHRLSLTEEKRAGKEVFEKVDMAQYTKRSFGMFSGELEKVTLLCDRSLAGVMIDRFGKEPVYVHRGEDFEFAVDVSVSPMFLSWIVGFGGKVRLLSPSSAVEKLKALLQQVQESCP